MNGWNLKFDFPAFFTFIPLGYCFWEYKNLFLVVVATPMSTPHARAWLGLIKRDCAFPCTCFFAAGWSSPVVKRFLLADACLAIEPPWVPPTCNHKTTGWTTPARRANR